MGLGWSCSRLGERVGRHERTIRRWEAGTVTPRPSERRLLAWVLDVPLDELFPAAEPAVVVAARCVVGARTIPDLQRAVVGLRAVLDTLDHLNKGVAP